MSLPSLPNLPQEIIAEIVTYLPTSSRLSLCLTKKVFKDACVRAIYRHIYLSGWRKIVLCCRSLVGNERAARSVRSISFDVAHFRQCLLLRAFQTLYHTALSCISPTVTSLEILSGTPLLSPCRHTFPALKTFTTTLVLCPLLTSFLSRHPTLTDLILFNNFLSPPLSLPILPNLKSFVGLADVALLLLPSSPIQHAGIAWAHAGQRTKCEQLMRIMKSVVSLIWFSTRLDAELVECLATYLGGLECLCFAGLIPIVGGRDEDFYDSLTTHMHAFPRLQIIDVRSRVPVCMDIHVLDEEFRLITVWAGQCEALEVCTMPSRTYWYRLKQSGMWVPVICPDSSLATIWLCKKARARGVRRVLNTSPSSPSSTIISSSSDYAPSNASSSEYSIHSISSTEQDDQRREDEQREEEESESQRAQVEHDTHGELMAYIDYIGKLGDVGVVTCESVGAFFRGGCGRRGVADGGGGGRQERQSDRGEGVGRTGAFELSRYGVL